MKKGIGKNKDYTLKIRRVWAMPNKWTFRIKPIKELLQKYSICDEMKILSGIPYKDWFDPFAGYNSPAEYKNDLDVNSPSNWHKDALELLKEIKSESKNCVLYDPPYSITQARQYGKKEFASMKYWADCKNEIARIIKQGGISISFGWNSNGLGKNRGFFQREILLVAHGGSKNDTICVVEQKIISCGKLNN